MPSPDQITFRPSTPMVVLAWVALHGTDPEDRAGAAQGLAAMVLEAADARPAPQIEPLRVQ